MLVQFFPAPVIATNIIEIFERCGTIDKAIVLGLGFLVSVWRVATDYV